MDIHKTEKRMIALLKRIDKLPEANKIIILKFRNECCTQGLSDLRVLFYLYSLVTISGYTKKPLKNLNEKEIKEIVSIIEQRKLAEWSKSKFKQTIKKFYQFADGLDWHSKKFPDKVSWIHARPRKNKLSLPIVLSKDEVLRIFKAAKGIREKALVSFMYESGCRSPDELFHMKISDVDFDEYGAKVKLSSGKVGSRIIRVVSCVPYLKSWIHEQHPNNKPDSYVWANIGSRNHGNVMSYVILTMIVKRWVKDAKITKRVTPYTFRRTRYTHLSTKIPTPLLYKYMGQVLGSSVIERYVALNNDDVDEAMLNFYGIKQKATDDILKPLWCSRCGKQNPSEKDYCQICHAPLTEKSMLEADGKKNEEMETLIGFMLKSKMETELSVLVSTLIQKELEDLKNKSGDEL